MQDTDKPYQAQAAQPAEMPETMVINGVTYRREFNDDDYWVNRIVSYIEIAKRSGVSFRQVVFLQTGQVIPD